MKAAEILRQKSATGSFMADFPAECGTLFTDLMMHEGSILTVTAVAPTITLRQPLSTGEAEHYEFRRVVGPRSGCKDQRPLKIGDDVLVKTVGQSSLLVERLTGGAASGCTYMLHN